MLLLFFVLAHGTITHFVPIADVRAGLQGEPVTHEVVERRLAQGAMLAFDFALLGLALYHGLNGIRGILLEWSFTARRKTAVTAALHTIGLGAFVTWSGRSDRLRALMARRRSRGPNLMDWEWNIA